MRHKRVRQKKTLTFTIRPAPSVQTRMTAEEWVESGESVGAVSSNVASIRYDKTTRSLTVAFVSGAVYLYKLVPKSRAMLMFNCNSLGTFVHLYLKRFYSYVVVREARS